MIGIEWFPFMMSFLEATGYTVEKLDNGDVRACRDGRHQMILKSHAICSVELFEDIIKQALEGFDIISEHTVEETEKILESCRKEVLEESVFPEKLGDFSKVEKYHGFIIAKKESNGKFYAFSSADWKNSNSFNGNAHSTIEDAKKYIDDYKKADRPSRK